jgi:hypothetical protein
MGWVSYFANRRKVGAKRRGRLIVWFGLVWFGLGIISLLGYLICSYQWEVGRFCPAVVLIVLWQLNRDALFSS